MFLSTYYVVKRSCHNVSYLDPKRTNSFLLSFFIVHLLIVVGGGIFNKMKDQDPILQKKIVEKIRDTFILKERKKNESQQWRERQ